MGTSIVRPNADTNGPSHLNLWNNNSSSDGTNWNKINAVVLQPTSPGTSSWIEDINGDENDCGMSAPSPTLGGNVTSVTVWVYAAVMAGTGSVLNVQCVFNASITTSAKQLFNIGGTASAAWYSVTFSGLNIATGSWGSSSGNASGRTTSALEPSYPNSDGDIQVYDIYWEITTASVSIKKSGLVMAA